MTISGYRQLFALALWALAAAPAAAATLRADYTLNFHPPNPCNETGLGDLSAATLNGTLGFASLDYDGVLVPDPGPPDLPLYAFAAGTDPASLDVPGSTPWIELALSRGAGPAPVWLPLYAFDGGAYEVGTLGVTIQAVPVPAALWLFGSGVAALGALARRKQA